MPSISTYGFICSLRLSGRGIGSVSVVALPMKANRSSSKNLPLPTSPHVPQRRTLLYLKTLVLVQALQLRHSDLFLSGVV